LRTGFIEKAARLSAVFVYILLGAVLYRTSVHTLLRMWQREDFTYGYIIPPIVLYLLWDKRDELKRIPPEPSWGGFFPLGAGIGLYVLGELGGEYTALFLSLWLVVVGLCWLHLGWRKLKVIAFPLAFLLVMFPPPNLIYSNVSLKLKLLSSRIGVHMLQFLGMSAYREGNIIDLGFSKLQVVDACSGLRYLIPLVALGFLLAYHYRLSFRKGAILVLSAIPVTIVTNSLRLASVGILYPIWGPRVAEGIFHDFSGWLIFMVSLAILLLEVWALNRWFPGRRLEPSIPLEEVKPVVGSMPQSVVAILLLGGTLAIFQGVNFREKVPLTKSLVQFPLAVSEWGGTRSSMEPMVLDVLKPSDYALIDYKDRHGKEVNVYVAYNESQRKGESSHSPDSCLPGSGWVFRDSGTIALPVKNGDGSPMRVSRAFVEKSGVRQLTYYWFPQRGRVLTNMYQLKIYAFWDALTRRRTDGALIRLITPVYESEQLGDAEARLQEFTRQIVPVLDTFLPGAG